MEGASASVRSEDPSKTAPPRKWEALFRKHRFLRRRRGLPDTGNRACVRRAGRSTHCAQGVPAKRGTRGRRSRPPFDRTTTLDADRTMSRVVPVANSLSPRRRRACREIRGNRAALGDLAYPHPRRPHLGCRRCVHGRRCVDTIGQGVRRHERGSTRGLSRRGGWGWISVAGIWITGASSRVLPFCWGIGLWGCCGVCSVWVMMMG